MLPGATITTGTRASHFGYVIADRSARVVGSPLMRGMIWILGQLMNCIALSADHFPVQASSMRWVRLLSGSWEIYLIDQRASSTGIAPIMSALGRKRISVICAIPPRRQPTVKTSDLLLRTQREAPHRASHWACSC